MKTSITLLLLATTLCASDIPPLSLDESSWFANPIAWKFGDGTITCVLSNANETALYEKAPLASNVTVAATFTPASAGGPGWSIAAVAITADRNNFWHLALVQSPKEHGRKPFFEISEMREGRWNAHSDLQVEINETTGQAWSFGQPHRLLLRMENNRIEGSVFGPDGTLMLRRRYVLNANAVSLGRPAVRIAEFIGKFSGLQAQWSAEIPGASNKKVYPAYGISNGLTDIRDKATGFFRVIKKPDGRWWTIDPLGRGVVLLGVDHVSFHGHWCEKLGYAPHGKKNLVKYPDKSVWEEETLGRLQKWGFNMLGAGCDHQLQYRGLIHTVFINIGDSFTRLEGDYQITPNENRPCSAFPNVFHPDFEDYCRFRARQYCAPNRDDPWLFGYFIDNELAWWGRGELQTGLFDAVMQKTADHTAKLALRDFLAKHSGNNLETFNKLWDTDLKSFDALLALDRLPSENEPQRAAKYNFLRLVADRYFSLASKAIRDVDPNHLVLGARFAGTGGAAPAVWEVSGQYCEVVTFNFYPMADLGKGVVYNHFGKTSEPVTTHFEKYYNHVRRPMLITEWSFPALDAGLPSVHGAGQRFRTQAERTAATSLFARTMLSMPFLLGYDYFMWVDEPELGISSDFPEDSNYGLINEDGVPYQLLTEMFTELHREAGAWRFRDAPVPLTQKSRSLPDAMTVARKASAADAVAGSFFKREGDTFTAGNGRLVVMGKLGDGRMLRQIILDGSEKNSGEYNAMLHTIDGGGNNRWTETRTVKAVTGRVENGVAILEITASGSIEHDRFDAVHRLLLPAGSPWFISELVSVRNTGETPLNLKSLFFRLNSDFKALPGKQPPNLWGAPKTGVWLDADDGRFFGAVASWQADITINFRVNPQGGTHPDAHLQIDQLELLPGNYFVPDTPVYLICAAGTGGESNWKKTVDAIALLLESWH
ncbi:MAG: hypothetical protein PHU80_00485 [Kiritimatiellae bacterium]|nr:hypothetical protein [Kiritimatiellia bacterium]